MSTLVWWLIAGLLVLLCVLLLMALVTWLALVAVVYLSRPDDKRHDE